MILDIAPIHIPPPPPAIPPLGGTVTLTKKHRKYYTPKGPKKNFLRLHWNCCSFGATIV